MDAGFTGFTFNNNIYGTDESIARVGELIKVVNGSAWAPHPVGSSGPPAQRARP
jgi:hypothetical protein